MQKIYTTIIFFLVVFLFSTCATENELVQKDIAKYLPPVPASFSAKDSTRLIANWTMGIKSYKANCAKCHGIFGKGKDSIPNFSKVQMDDYKASFLAADKLNHAVIAKMTEEELNAVFIFVTNIMR
jgi:mono/diheme cytochrome c family protein